MFIKILVIYCLLTFSYVVNADSMWPEKVDIYTKKLDSKLIKNGSAVTIENSKTKKISLILSQNTINHLQRNDEYRSKKNKKDGIDFSKAFSIIGLVAVAVQSPATAAQAFDGINQVSKIKPNSEETTQAINNALDSQKIIDVLINPLKSNFKEVILTSDYLEASSKDIDYIFLLDATFEFDNKMDGGFLSHTIGFSDSFTNTHSMNIKGILLDSSLNEVKKIEATGTEKFQFTATDGNEAIALKETNVQLKAREIALKQYEEVFGSILK